MRLLAFLSCVAALVLPACGRASSGESGSARRETDVISRFASSSRLRSTRSDWPAAGPAGTKTAASATAGHGRSLFVILPPVLTSYRQSLVKHRPAVCKDFLTADSS